MIEKKINYFMQNYIKSRFELDQINWIFSVSGGKDSYVMARSIYEWYIENRYSFYGVALFVNQWEDDVAEHIRNDYKWLNKIVIVDAIDETQEMIKANQGAQAPCRKCADIRRTETDKYMKAIGDNGKINLVCRGLHLTDTSVSLLWRHVMGYEPKKHFGEKAKAIEKVWDNGYLVKPLCIAREYECQDYVKRHNYKATNCECYALKYPSRRDIVEESILSVYREDLWEYDIVDVDQYLSKTLNTNLDIIKELSLNGIESKESILSDEFFNKMYASLSMIANNYYIKNKEQFSEDCLDQIGEAYIKNKQKNVCSVEHKIPCPAIFREKNVSEFSKRMICTMGPFWGAVGLKPEHRKQVFDLQEAVFGIAVDEKWQQTIALYQHYEMLG